jgi:transcriptional regulator with XRE-family HTH domain
MQDGYFKNKILLQTVLGEIIKEYRLKTNKSISYLTAEIGMTKSLLADTEKGIKDPQLSTLWRLSQALEIPLSDIIKELESKLGKDFSLID